MFRGNKKGGIREAAKILQMLSVSEKQRILNEIAIKDPERAELIKQNMVIFEDLVHLSTQMISELLREIKLDDLALGLKIASDELKNHILNNISKGMKSEIEDILNGKPVQLSKVEDAIDKIMVVVRKKVERGELILDPGKNEEYV